MWMLWLTDQSVRYSYEPCWLFLRLHESDLRVGKLPNPRKFTTRAQFCRL